MDLVKPSLRCLLLLSCLLVLRTAGAQEIRVAAAADLKFALDELGAQFEKQTGRRINVSYGSSGNFFGRIVIWMPADAQADLAKLGWKALPEPGVERIAIANPEHAPYGRAAVAALRSAGIFEQVRRRLVYGENIAQAAQFVASGSAQAGILALSLAVSPPMRAGKRWEIPADMHPPIEQGAIILKSAKDKEGARAFLAFLKSDAARKILESYGFVLPASGNASAPRR